jgi:hypothetical protein
MTCKGVHNIGEVGIDFIQNVKVSERVFALLHCQNIQGVSFLLGGRILTHQYQASKC